MSRFFAAVLAAAAAVLILAVAPGAQSSVPRFEDVAAQAGLKFTHVNGARGEFWYPEMIGSGVATFDYDNDGDLDVFLVQGAEWLGRGPSLERRSSSSSPAAEQSGAPTSKLFRNDLDGPGGTLRFTDVTREAGVGLVAYGMGAAVGDYDNDGDLDLYVTTFDDNVLYRNEGNGRFTDVTASANANDPRWSTSAAFVDYDRDGHLDLFIANYVDFTPAGNKPCFEPAGGRDYCGPLAYRSIPARLLRNKGDGTFEDTSDRAGITRAFGNGLGVVAGDYDGDTWPDVYVANDATANQLWMNRRDGTFEDMGLLSGTAYNAAGRPEGSMGIASGDVDRDGDEDLAVTNLVGETFAYYENDGQGGFDDRRAAVGLAAPTAMMTGFGADWFDANNDGWLDLFIANGAVNLIPSLRGTPNPFQQQNQLFLGRPDSLGEAAGGSGPAGSPSRPSSATRVRLQEVTASAGPGLAPPGVGRGVAFGDLDLDGRVDLVVSNNNGAARVLRNLDGSDHHWIRLKLTQPDRNRFALGAAIRVDLPGTQPIVRRVRSGGSYLSSSDFRLHVGLGSARAPLDLTVTWPDGTTQRVTGLAVDREHVIARSQRSPGARMVSANLHRDGP